jgi:hypothetical protein
LLCYRRGVLRTEPTTTSHQPRKARILYSWDYHGSDGNWVDESPVVRSFVWQQPYQDKPLPSQLIVQQERDEESNATVLMTNDVTLKTLSPTSWENKVKKMVLDGDGGKWMTSTIFCSIKFNAAIARFSTECHHRCSWKLAVKS